MFAKSYDPCGFEQQPLSPRSHSSYEKQKRQDTARRRQAELERMRRMEEKYKTEGVLRHVEVRQRQLEEEGEELDRHSLDLLPRGDMVDHIEDTTSFSNILPPPYASISHDDLEDEFAGICPPRTIQILIKPVRVTASRSDMKQAEGRCTDTFSTIRTKENQPHGESRQDYRGNKQKDEMNQEMNERVETSSSMDIDDNDTSVPLHIIAAQDLSDDEEEEEDLDSIWRNQDRGHGVQIMPNEPNDSFISYEAA